MRDRYLSTLTQLAPPESSQVPLQEDRVGIVQKPQAYVELRRWGRVFKPLEFQKQVIEGIGALVKRSPTCGLLSLPTGSGKTLTASRILLDAMLRSGLAQSLWIAPQRELLFQAADGLQGAWWSGAGPDSLNIQTVESGQDLIPDDHPTCWLMTPAMAKKALDLLSGKVSVIVFDEAHHAAAEMFGEVWNSFRNTDQGRPNLCLGLSATPERENRTEGVLLREAFQGVLFLPRQLGPEPIKQLISMGVLSEPTFYLVPNVPEYARRANLSDTRALRTLVTDPQRWSAVTALTRTTSRRRPCWPTGSQPASRSGPGRARFPPAPGAGCVVPSRPRWPMLPVRRGPSGEKAAA